MDSHCSQAKHKLRYHQHYVSQTRSGSCPQMQSLPNITILVQDINVLLLWSCSLSMFPLASWFIHLALSKCGLAAMFFLKCSGLLSSSAMHTVVVYWSPDFWFMNIGVSHCKRGRRFPRHYSGFHLTFWTITLFTLGVIFVGRWLLQRVTVVLNSLHLYTICRQPTGGEILFKPWGISTNLWDTDLTIILVSSIFHNRYINKWKFLSDLLNWVPLIMLDDVEIWD